MATRKPAEEFKSDAAVSRRVLVNVKRDQTTATPRVVWQHEVPIMEAVFGEGNVVEVDRAALDEGYSPRTPQAMLIHNKKQDTPARPSAAAGLDFVFIGGAQAEYERLAVVYGKHPEINQTFVENVFGRYSTGMFAKIIGKPALIDLPAEQLRSLILSYGYSLPLASWDSTDAEKRAAADAHATFHGLQRGDLVKLADEVGVEVGA